MREFFINNWIRTWAWMRLAENRLLGRPSECTLYPHCNLCGALECPLHPDYGGEEVGETVVEEIEDEPEPLLVMTLGDNECLGAPDWSNPPCEFCDEEIEVRCPNFPDCGGNDGTANLTYLDCGDLECDLCHSHVCKLKCGVCGDDEAQIVVHTRIRVLVIETEDIVLIYVEVTRTATSF